MSINKNLLTLIGATAAVGLLKRKGGKSVYRSGSGIPRLSSQRQKEIEIIIGDRWSQTEEQLLKKTASWIPPLDSNKFYIISTAPIEKFYNMENVAENTGTKPFFTSKTPEKLEGKEGSSPIWFAPSDQWIRWLAREMPHWLYGSNYVYEIELNWDNIGIVDQEFINNYVSGASGGWFGGSQKVEWGPVVARYSGLYDPTGHKLDRWDIPSGCVWNWDGIHSIRLVASKPEMMTQQDETIMVKGDVTFGGSFYK